MIKKYLQLPYIIPGIVIFFGIVISWYLIASKPSTNKIIHPPIRPEVAVTPAIYTKVTLPIEALGTVIPSQEVIIRSQVSGKILELGKHMEPGGIVQSGETLFRIDDADYKNAVQRSESALAQAKASYDLEMGQQYVAKRELEQLKNTLPIQGKALQKSRLALRAPQLAQAKAALKTAEANLHQSLLDLQRTTLKSPFNALVIERNASIGSQASISEPLAKLVNTDSYWVETFIPLDRFQTLTIMQYKDIYATITSSTGQKFQGKIFRSIGNLDKNTRMGKILIEVLDPLGLKDTKPHAPLILGDHVQVAIMAGEIDKSIVIPRSSLHNGSNVWILSKNTLDIRPVEIAWKDTKNIYITSGIEPGELIITSYIHTPIQGMELKNNTSNNMTTKQQIDNHD